tara:strand:- start:5436 stop:6176 length:741 start_codon:yes stop_codon:yes gene_type:complete
MRCCFSGRETPAEKRFILYYPPAMAHQKWERSVYACASAGETIRETVERLRSFFRRYVFNSKVISRLAAGVVGMVLFLLWLRAAYVNWMALGPLVHWVHLVVSIILMSIGVFHLRRFLARLHSWKESGRQVVLEELDQIGKMSAGLSDDPTAEEVALVMRRRCPDVVSQIAFEGSNFHAFTYLDFILFPELKHPANEKELPDEHSLNRDAYYVGELVYDSWRVFHKDDRHLDDPRFAGSDGRRGVL